MHRTTIQPDGPCLGTPPEACKVMARHPGVNADMVASALQGLHDTRPERVWTGMVDAYADLVADQRSVPRDVHELVAPGATRDDGRRARRIRIGGGRIHVVVAV